MRQRDGAISRRDFLQASTALVVTFGAAVLAEGAGSAQGPFDTHPSHIDPNALDSWLAVAFHVACWCMSTGTVAASSGQVHAVVRPRLAARTIATCCGVTNDAWLVNAFLI
jgi:hypothetical protein